MSRPRRRPAVPLRPVERPRQPAGPADGLPNIQAHIATAAIAARRAVAGRFFPRSAIASLGLRDRSVAEVRDLLARKVGRPPEGSETAAEAAAAIARSHQQWARYTYVSLPPDCMSGGSFHWTPPAFRRITASAAPNSTTSRRPCVPARVGEKVHAFRLHGSSESGTLFLPSVSARAERSCSYTSASHRTSCKAHSRIRQGQPKSVGRASTGDARHLSSV
jgi:hypothetical protein